MKELSIEEKAKAYDEAIERAKGAHNGAKSDKKNGVTDKITEYTIQLTETIFPSLKESEDERMRNAAINACKYMVDNFENSTKQYEDAISWLEKQGEQNLANSAKTCKDEKIIVIIPKFRVGDVIRPKGSTAEYAIESISGECYHGKGWGLHISCEEDYELVEKKPAWSEEDELHIRELESLVKQVWATAEHKNDKDTIHKMSDLSFFLKTLKPQLKQEWSVADDNTLLDTINILRSSGKCSTDRKLWLLSLKDRIQSKQEWSKEDKKRYISCLQRLGTGNPEQPETINSKWFKEHVYPQNTWKPSEEQIECLSSHIAHREKDESSYSLNVLKDLLGQLKKLREE